MKHRLISLITALALPEPLSPLGVGGGGVAGLDLRYNHGDADD